MKISSDVDLSAMLDSLRQGSEPTGFGLYADPLTEQQPVQGPLEPAQETIGVAADTWRAADQSEALLALDVWQGVSAGNRLFPGDSAANFHNPSLNPAELADQLARYVLGGEISR